MAPLRALLLVLAGAALARAAPIKVTARNCDDAKAAFASLLAQYANATKPTPLSLALVLDCAGTFAATADNGCLLAFATGGPPPSAKHPPIKIGLSTNCKKGENVTMTVSPDGAVQKSKLFEVTTAGYEGKLDFSVKGPLIVREASQVFGAEVRAGSKSSLTIMDLVGEESQTYINVEGWDSVSIVGGGCRNCDWGIRVQDSKSVKISKMVITDGKGYAISLWSAEKVSVTGNNLGLICPSETVPVTVGLKDTRMPINVDISKNVLTTNATVPVCITTARANVTKATVKVSGFTGIIPIIPDSTLKPAGYPTSVACNIAKFSIA